MCVCVCVCVCVYGQVLNRNWRAARAISDQVNDIVANFSSTYTLEDVRRCVCVCVCMHARAVHMCGVNTCIIGLRI